MFWKLKRRLKTKLFSSGWFYGGAMLCLTLFMNIIVLHRNFAILEGENYIDPGGTREKRKLEIIDTASDVFLAGKLHSAPFLRSAFENKLRKLLHIMESNLDRSFLGNGDVANVQEEIPFEMYFPDRSFYCDDVARIGNRTYLASGWTKAVYSGVYKGSPVVIKTVDAQGQDVSTCMKRGLPESTCYIRAARKIVKEIVVLQALANENVLKVLGFCLPRGSDDNPWVAMVTELGESVDLIKLLQMSWEDRLRVCLDITKIVHLMSRTPYGSMSMNDFRRQQFVLVDGVLKLSDVDDTGFTDPPCVTDHDCDITFSSANFSTSSRCLQNRCIDYNEKRNVFNAGRHFVTFLLPHGAPALLQPIINRVIDGYSNLTMSSKELLQALNKITELYKSGWYMNRTEPSQSKTAYKTIENADLPGLYDYRCRFSLSVMACTVSAYDQREAEDVCDMDEQCRGFVVSPHKTWTGRVLVHLKNGIAKPSYNSNTTLFLKPG